MEGILKWLTGVDAGELSGHRWTIGFVSDYGSYVRLGLMVLLAFLVWLTVHCYRREGRGRVKLRFFLAGLRIAIISLTLMILFQPALVIDITEKFYSTVVFLIDDSGSMSFVDNHAGQDQQQRLDRLCKKFDITHRQAGKMTRCEMLSMALKSGIIDKLREVHPIEIMKFSTQTPPGQSGYTLSLGAITRLRKEGEEKNKNGEGAGKSLDEILSGLTAGGFETDYAPAIRDILKKFQGRRLGALVVVGDGRATLKDSGMRLDAAIAATANQGLPCYSVLVGDPEPPKNLAVTGIRVPHEIRSGSTVELKALVTARNVYGEVAKLKLYKKPAGEEWPVDMSTLAPLLEKEVAFKGKEDPENTDNRVAVTEREIVFRIRTRDADSGKYVYRVMAELLDGEKSGEDNWSEVFVTFSDKKLRILLVSADAGWEFQYLRNYLLRQPDIYRLSVWQQNAGKDINQAASSGMKLTRLPDSLEEMIDSGEDRLEGIPPGYHVIILYDPMPTKGGYDSKFMTLLKKYVSRHGGGLCYIASNKNTWDVLTDKAAKPLRDILPVIVDSNREDLSSLYSKSGRNVGYPIQPTAYGADHPVMRLTGNSASSLNMWKLMPGIYWSHAVRGPKLHARVLAVSTHPSHATSGNKQEPVLAVHSHGKGKVVYLGFDETWRWRVVESGFYYRRFWSNVIDYLATKSDSRVIINTGGDRFKVGGKITVIAEVYDENYTEYNGPTFALKKINLDTGKETDCRLEMLRDQPGMFKAAIEAKEEGRFRFTCDKSFAPSEKVSEKRIIIEKPKSEDIRPESSPRDMNRIASRPEFSIGIDRIDKLPELIPDGVRTTRRQRYLTLWDTGLMWMLLAGMLAMEWFFRRRASLA